MVCVSRSYSSAATVKAHDMRVIRPAFISSKEIARALRARQVGSDEKPVLVRLLARRPVAHAGVHSARMVGLKDNVAHVRFAEGIGLITSMYFVPSKSSNRTYGSLKVEA